MSAHPASAPELRRTLILVDTSVWVKFFRQPSAHESCTLDTLLSFGPVATCAPIQAEVVSGAPTLAEFRRLRDVFSALVDLPLPPDVWQKLEERRFALARRGTQAALTDLLIAITAEQHHVPLWTLDEDFERIAAVVPLLLYRPAAP
ncbi:MAG: PIN domain-containing protein [Candidatus Omnitrophica bacterium]|nr:PIN domain-containing protein [Candidatus Omnitrophota bacterium]